MTTDETYRAAYAAVIANPTPENRAALRAAIETADEDLPDENDPNPWPAFTTPATPTDRTLDDDTDDDPPDDPT